MRWFCFVAFVVGCAEEAPAPAAPVEAPVEAAPAPKQPEAAPSAPAAVGKVFFVEPAEGATLTSPFKVGFGVEGMTVHPAGELIDGTGHHHLVIDGAAVPVGTVVPADEKHIHYGKGQTETQLTLPAGPHTLTLQFADGSHKSYGPEWSTTINVTVQ
jgi:hypothetical protein